VSVAAHLRDLSCHGNWPAVLVTALRTGTIQFEDSVNHNGKSRHRQAKPGQALDMAFLMLFQAPYENGTNQ
jgi:hypothetical protein